MEKLDESKLAVNSTKAQLVVIWRGGIASRLICKANLFRRAISDEKEVYAMIVVPVKEGENIERAIKKFKRKFDKTGVIKELRRRQQFDKPSELKRIKMQHAIYVQQMHAHDDM